MRRLSLLICLCFIPLFYCCQSGIETTQYNFGFEKTTANQNLPDNWIKWGSDYNLLIDTVVKYSGNNSIMIEPSGERVPNTFGSIAYPIPAIYQGTEIELKAYMKLKNVAEGAAGLVMRLDGASGVLGFDNMQQKNLHGTSDWKMYSVKLPYSEKAKTIYIGALLTGTGQIWVDDFQVLIDGKDIKEARIKKQKEYNADKDKEFDNGSKILSIALTESKIEDLTVLGKAWGFLKYYHPSIAKGEYNWDYELFRILPKILDAENKSERNKILSEWTAGLGKFDTGKSEENKKEIKISPDLVWIDNSILGDELSSQLIAIKNAKRSEDSYYIDLAPGVGNPVFKNENPYAAMKYPDAGFHLLSLYRYWNIIQYYFPYKNLIEENWNNLLPEFIPEFFNASNEIEYKLAALALIARVHDTHANIWGRDEALKKFHGSNFAPLKIRFVENKAVVTGYYDSGAESNLKVGDVIERINNKPVEEIIKERLSFTPASNYPTKLRNIARDLLRTNDSIISIEYKHDDLRLSKNIQCISGDEIYRQKNEKKDSCFKIINEGISYLYPGSVKNSYLPKIMDAILETKGLIIDLRCYPSDFIVFTLSDYLMPDSTSFVKFSNGSITFPGLFTMTEVLKAGRENKDYYKGKVVIIINETTQSQAEYTTMAFRTAPDAIVIGSTTAGADGNVSQFDLPGGISTMISGIGVYYPDGTETQRIGIVPDIEMKPSIKGIKEGKDELLEKAIGIINQK